MIDDARAALGAVQQELRLLDSRLEEADGTADPLSVAEALVALSKMKDKVVKLAGDFEPPPRPRDDGPTLPGFGGPDDTQGGGDRGGKGQRRR